MMSSLKRNLFLSVFGAAMSATVALAADLPAPPVIEYEPETPVEIGSSWYLRGDLGFAVYQGGHASWTDPTNTNLIGFHHENIANGWVAGIGAGYYFNKHFRADVILDYRHKVKYDSTSTCTPVSPPAGCTPGDSYEKLNFSAWTLMANGYVDLGTYYSINPYVGGGVGVAWLKASNHKTVGTGSPFKNKTRTNFAWNLTTGATFDLAENVKLDANYRFVSLGKARTGGRRDNSSTEPVRFENLYAHDFRVGLRYDLN
ncbi:porin family protein [Cohaesibacter sp. CAU 1516]|nr:porin family protein [Cohaesibacter sp. CAU 1516]